MTDLTAALAEALLRNGVARENVASIGAADQWVPDTEMAAAIVASLPPAIVDALALGQAVTQQAEVWGNVFVRREPDGTIGIVDPTTAEVRFP